MDPCYAAGAAAIVRERPSNEAPVGFDLSPPQREGLIKSDKSDGGRLG